MNWKNKGMGEYREFWVIKINTSKYIAMEEKNLWNVDMVKQEDKKLQRKHLLPNRIYGEGRGVGD